MENCRLPDGVTSISVRPYYTMLSRVYLALAMGFLVQLGQYGWASCMLFTFPVYSRGRGTKRFCELTVRSSVSCL